MKHLFGRKTNLVIVSGIVVGGLLLGYRLSFGIGFLIGLGTSMINTGLISVYVDRVLTSRSYRVFPGILLYVLRSMILMFPFALVLKWPNYVNVFCAVAGILYFKAVLFGSVLLPRKEN